MIVDTILLNPFWMCLQRFPPKSKANEWDLLERKQVIDRFGLSIEGTNNLDLNLIKKFSVSYIHGIPCADPLDEVFNRSRFSELLLSSQLLPHRTSDITMVFVTFSQVFSSWVFRSVFHFGSVPYSIHKFSKKIYPKHKQQRSTNHQNIQKINIISIIYSNQSLNTHLFKFSGPINALYSNVIQINTSELLFQVTTSSIKPHINQHHWSSFNTFTPLWSLSVCYHSKIKSNWTLRWLTGPLQRIQSNVKYLRKKI